MKFTDLKKHLSDGKLSCVYIITGEDKFLVQTAVSRFKALVTNLPEMNLCVFSGDTNEREIIESCEILPIMDKMRVVIVNDFSGEGQSFEPYLKNPNPSTILVLTVSSIKENLSKIFGAATLVDCARLDENALMQYIARSANELNCSFKTDAARLLIDYCSFDLSRISKETEKLSHLKAGSIVETADVKELVTPEADYKIYELAEAVGTRKNEQAAKILKNLIQANTAPVALLGMLYSHFRRLLFCLINKGDPNLAALLSVKPYAVQKSSQQASKYTPLRLKKICDILSAADYDFKSGRISDVLALESCVFEILST